ncbi:hypothetical protein BH09DEP1_BH09DEP1_7500 [soil metagenome]
MNLSTTLSFSIALVIVFSLSAAPKDYREFFSPRLKEACPNVNVGASLGDDDYGSCEVIYNALWYAYFGKVKPWLENYNKQEHVWGGLASYNARATAEQPESLCIGIELLGQKLGWSDEVIKQEIDLMLKERSSLLWQGRKDRFITNMINWVDNISPDTYALFLRRNNA